MTLNLKINSSNQRQTEARCARIKLTLGFGLIFMTACSLTTVRPVQEMSDTAAALKGAKEIAADTYAPELFRQAADYFFKARREYKFKNFAIAKEYAYKARKLAEQAEFESLKMNSKRQEEEGVIDQFENKSAPAKAFPKNEYASPVPQMADPALNAPTPEPSPDPSAAGNSTPVQIPPPPTLPSP